MIKLPDNIKHSKKDIVTFKVGQSTHTWTSNMENSKKACYYSYMEHLTKTEFFLRPCNKECALPS